MAMFTGYAWARCRECVWSMFAEPREQAAVDRAANRHVTTAHHAVDSGLTAGMERPEICPLCQEVVCDHDCEMALYLGWPREEAPDAEAQA